MSRIIQGKIWGKPNININIHYRDMLILKFLNFKFQNGHHFFIFEVPSQPSPWSLKAGQIRPQRIVQPSAPHGNVTTVITLNEQNHIIIYLLDWGLTSL